MPFQAPPVRDEKDGYAAYLLQQQDAFRCAIYGLTDEQASLAPTTSTLSVGTLVKHVTFVQRGWLDQALAAPEPVPTGNDEVYAAREEAFMWTGTDTVASVLDAFDEVSRGVLAAVHSTELDTPVPVPPAPWNPRDVAAWSVRWVWLHLIEELARHAGHADMVREAVDGATMYELVAGREDFPETPWLKPWQPATAGS